LRNKREQPSSETLSVSTPSKRSGNTRGVARAAQTPSNYEAN
jgi:hypothetical protein